MTETITNTVRLLVKLLVAEDYTRLYQLDKEKGMPVALLASSIQWCSGRLTLPPPPFPRIDIIQHDDLPHRQFVDVRLWVDGEESDLTLQCTLFTDEIQDKRYAFAITDIDVL